MVKLNGKQKILLIMYTLWYLLAVQFITQELMQLESDFIGENNIFKTEEIMLVFLNFIVIFFSIVFILFQGFVYRFILILFKSEKYPSLFTSFYYLIIGFLPFSLTIIAIHFSGFLNLYDVATNIYFKVVSMVVVNVIYVLIIAKREFLDSKKSVILLVFLTLINLLVLLVNVN